MENAPPFMEPRNLGNEPKMQPRLRKVEKRMTMIELAKMGLHGTFGNLHTYLHFRAGQLQSVSGTPEPCLPSQAILLSPYKAQA